MINITFIILTISSILLILEVFFYFNLKKEAKKKQKKVFSLLKEIEDATEQKKKLDASIYLKTQTIDNDIEILKEKRQKEYETFEEDIRKKESSLKEKYEEAEDEYKKVFSYKIQECQDLISKEEEKLEELKKSYNARIESVKREEEQLTKRDYYRWQLSEEIIDDIKCIQSIKSKLSNPSIIDKVLWKTYYEKATNDLITRVIGNSSPCGIYKITNLLNEKVYIGQSVNARERIKQHVKSGVGAVVATNNKLYTSIKQDGLWNFTWEIIEECSRDKLNEREAFWIDFYDSANYGMNGNAGIRN